MCFIPFNSGGLEDAALDMPEGGNEEAADDGHLEETFPGDEHVTNEELEGGALLAANAWLKGELGTMSEDPNAVIPIPHSGQLRRLEIALCTLAGLCQCEPTNIWP